MRTIPLALLASLTLSAQITREPTAILHLDTAIPAQYRSAKISFVEMETNGADLFFRVTSEALGGKQAILQTDFEGHFKSWFICEEPLNIVNFVVDAIGNVYALETATSIATT